MFVFWLLVNLWIWTNPALPEILHRPDCKIKNKKIKIKWNTDIHTGVGWRSKHRLCWSCAARCQNWTISCAKKWCGYDPTFLCGAFANDLITLILFRELSSVPIIYKFQSQPVPGYGMEDKSKHCTERKVKGKVLLWVHHQVTLSSIKEIIHTQLMWMCSLYPSFTVVLIIMFNAFWRNFISLFKSRMAATSANYTSAKRVYIFLKACHFSIIKNIIRNNVK